VVNGVRETISVAIDRRRGRLYYTGGSGQPGASGPLKRADLDGAGVQELLGAGTLTCVVAVDLP
jgi:hypothetical protein